MKNKQSKRFINEWLVPHPHGSCRLISVFSVSELLEDIYSWFDSEFEIDFDIVNDNVYIHSYFDIFIRRLIAEVIYQNHSKEFYMYQFREDLTSSLNYLINFYDICAGYNESENGYQIDVSLVDELLDIVNKRIYPVDHELTGYEVIITYLEGDMFYIECVGDYRVLLYHYGTKENIYRHYRNPFIEELMKDEKHYFDKIA